MVAVRLRWCRHVGPSITIQISQSAVAVAIEFDDRVGGLCIAKRPGGLMAFQQLADRGRNAGGGSEVALVQVASSIYVLAELVVADRLVAPALVDIETTTQPVWTAA